MQCPNCGAQLDFEQTLGTFAVCGYCSSSLVVDKNALKIAGKMAVLRPPLGPLALGFTGSYRNRGFGVIGRVRYAYPAGFWDEWHIHWEDGSTGWISQDEDRLVVEDLLDVGDLTVDVDSLQPGTQMTVRGVDYTIREIGSATLEAAEGQLPFAVEPGESHQYVDLVADGKTFGTLEVLEDESRLFTGQVVGTSDLLIDQEFHPEATDSLNPELAAAGSRQRVVKKAGREQGLNCQACGGTLSPPSDVNVMECEHCGSQVDLLLERVRCPQCQADVPVFSFEDTSQLVCSCCQARLETGEGGVSILEEGLQLENQGGNRFPIGSRFEYAGEVYHVAGHIRLVERDEGRPYYTREYMLFSQAVGYRWLSEYNGHFTIYNDLKNFPKTNPRTLARGRKLTFRDQTWKVFEKGRATIDLVLGELPWIAARGDRVHYADAIDPPFALSAEWDESEISWSIGQYVDRSTVAQAFGVKESALPTKRGVGACQPYRQSVFAQGSLKVMGLFALLALVLAIWSMSTGFKNPESMHVTRSQYNVEHLTEFFEIHDAPSLCEFEFEAPVNNQWVYLDVAIIDENDDAIMDFSAEMSYYHGVEGGESWSEGSTKDRVPVRIEKPGRYRLLLKGEAGSGETKDNFLNRSSYAVDIRIKERITLTRYFVILFIFCLIWIACIVIPRMVFEGNRWKDE